MMEVLMTIGIAAVPLIELQAAIPIAIGVYHFHPVFAWFLAVFGNMLPVWGLFWVFDYLFRHKSHWPMIQWIKQHSLKKLGPGYEQYGEIALFFLAALPFPLTGVYTASFGVLVLNLPLWRSFFWILAGNMVAGLLITLASLGIIRLM